MRLGLVIVAFAALSPRVATAVPTILNGDFDGPVAIGSAPPDWFNWQNTPDTCDALGPFNNTPIPWTPSPTSGNFVRSGGSFSPGASEAIGQIVTGFTPGLSYTIAYHQTNLGFEHPTSGAWLGTEGYWDLLIDGVLSDSTSPLVKPATNIDPIVWSPGSFTFIAPAPSFELALVARSTDPSGLAAYMGIDGVRYVPVPAPGMGAIVLTMGGVVTRRRRPPKNAKRPTLSGQAFA